MPLAPQTAEVSRSRVRASHAQARIRLWVAMLGLLASISPAFSQQLISNGGFESGLYSWTRFGNFYATATQNPHSGSRYLYLSTTESTPGNNLSGTCYQEINIPSNATSATLRYWYNITSQDTRPSTEDWLGVQVHDDNGNYLAAAGLYSNRDRTTSNNYSQSSAVSLYPYRGQTVRIFFYASTDEIYPTVFRIDDVSVTVTVPPTLPGPFTLSNQAPVCDTSPPAGPAVTLNWSPSSNAAEYRVFRDGVLLLGGITGTTFYNNLNVNAGQSYAYMVQAVNAGGTRNSNAVNVNIPSNICQTLQQVSPPIVSPGTAHFHQFVEVSATCNTPGSQIRFTDDGSDPTVSSALWTGNHTYTTSKTLRFRAFKTGMTPSNRVTAFYTSGLPTYTLFHAVPVHHLHVVKLLPMPVTGGATVEYGKNTWLVIHGMWSSPSEGNIADLARAMGADPEVDQVLRADWSEMAGLGNLAAAGHVELAAEGFINLLTGLGITGPKLNIVGHSLGSYVGEAIKDSTAANRFVALDPARLSGWAPPSHTDFRDNTEVAWAFYSGQLGLHRAGNEDMSIRADDSFVMHWYNVPSGFGAWEAHGQLVFVYADLVRNAAFGGRFVPSSMRIPGTTRPWYLDRFSSFGAPLLPSVVPSFEGKIEAEYGNAPGWRGRRAIYFNVNGGYVAIPR